MATKLKLKAYEIGFADGLRRSFHPSKVAWESRGEYVRGYNKGLATLERVVEATKSGKRNPPPTDMFSSK